jgi:cobalamin biosynthesis Mg chelatase CobN
VTGGARARRTVALVLALVVAALGLLLAQLVASAQTQPEPCGAVPIPGCTSATTQLDPTTTTLVDDVTTTTTVATTTTARRTATTVRPTTTTAGESAQEETTTTLTATTQSDLLVPGDGTEGAESTTTTVVTATRVSDGGPSDATLITLVIVGLVLIAGVVALLTWRYWVATRPPLRRQDNASAPTG